MFATTMLLTATPFAEKLAILAGSAFAIWTLPFFLFWGVVFVASLILGFADKYWPIGMVWTVLFVYFAWVNLINPVEYFWEHPWLTLGKVFLYLGVGFAWMVFRWVRFVEVKIKPQRAEALRNFVKEFPEHRAKILAKDKNASDWATWLDRKPYEVEEIELDESQMQSWLDYLIANGRTVSRNHPLSYVLTKYIKENSDKYPHAGDAVGIPSWSNYKADYAAYWFYWPVDMVIYFLGTALRDLWRVVSNRLKAVFDRYATNRAVRPVVIEEKQ